jgi:O-antigen/teichoic acid export membrane protein
MKRIAISRPIANLTKVVFTVILIYLGFSYFGPLLGFILQSFLILLINFPLKHFIGPSGYINKKYIMTNYVMQAFFISLLWLILNQTPYIILTILKNNTATGIFTVASVITSEIAVIPSILSDALFPINSQLCIYRNAKKNQCYLIKLIFRYSLFIMLPITVFLITFSKPIILFYSSSDYLEAYNLFPILSIASLFFGCGVILLNNLFAIGKPKIQRNILVVTSLSFLLLSVPLTIIFSALGISLAYSLSVIILSFLSFYYIKKYLHFNIPFTDIKKLLTGSIVSLIFLYFMSLFVRNLYLGIILFFVACFIYFIILIPLKFFKEDDIIVINYIEKKSPILKKELNKFKNFLSKFVDVSDQKAV